MAVMAACAAAGWGPAAAYGETVKLTTVPLPSTIIMNEIDRGGPAMLTIENGTTKKITLGETEVVLAFSSPARFALQANGKSTALQPLNGQPALDAATVLLGKEQKYVLHFPRVVAGSRVASVTYRSGGVQKGTVGGVNIALYDADTDGCFKIGRDGIRLGDIGPAATAFAPLMNYVGDKTAMYEIKDCAADGSALTVEKYGGKTEKLQVSHNATALEYHVAIASSDATTSGTLSLRAGMAGEMAVLPGSYRIVSGVAVTADRKVAGTIIGGNAVEVAEGKVAKLEVGGPFVLEYQVNVSGGKISVNGATFVLKGKGGEAYRAFKHAAEPEVVLQVDGRAIPLGKMRFG